MYFLRDENLLLIIKHFFGACVVLNATSLELAEIKIKHGAGSGLQVLVGCGEKGDARMETEEEGKEKAQDGEDKEGKK